MLKSYKHEHFISAVYDQHFTSAFTISSSQL